MFDIDISLIEKAQNKSSQLKELIDSLKDASLLDKYESIMIRKYSLDMAIYKYQSFPCQKNEEDLLDHLHAIPD